MLASRSEIKVVMDWTDYDNDNHSTLHLNLVTTHGRTTPLVWWKTNESYPVATVVCFKDHGMKAPWCIVASQPTLSGSSIIQWYAKRRDKLLFIHAVATVFLTVLGAAGEQLGYDKGLKANTVKHRTLSLFRQGCIYFDRLSRWPTTVEIRKSIQTFTELLIEHENMSSILQYI